MSVVRMSDVEEELFCLSAVISETVGEIEIILCINTRLVGFAL